MIETRRPEAVVLLHGMGRSWISMALLGLRFKRAGYEEDAKAIQALWLDGKRDEAAARVPDAMVTQFQALGTADMVRERLRRYQAAGINTLKLGLDSAGPLGPARFELLEQIVDIVENL